jgi:hemolysin activation/secretion protein
MKKMKVSHIWSFIIHLSAFLFAFSLPVSAEELRIRNIQINNLDVFDRTHKEFRLWPFQIANRLHVKTRQAFIRNELLLQEGDILDKDLMIESERNLRRFAFLTDVSFKVIPINDNEADLIVHTEDQWTTNVKLSFGTAGQHRIWDIGIEESNFLGLGKQVSLQHSRSPEREGISGGFRDPRFLGTRHQLDVRTANFSDGHAHSLAMDYPFYSQDSRWSYNVYGNGSKRDQHLYFEGTDAMAIESIEQSAGISISRAWGQRYKRTFLGIGFGYYEALYPFTRILNSDAADQLEQSSTTTFDDNELYSGGISLNVDRQNFEKFYYLDRFGRTEDLPIGFRSATGISFSHNQMGSDFFTIDYNGRWATGHSGKYFVANANATMRREQSEWNHMIANLGARYFHQKKKLNLGLFRAPIYTFGVNLQADFTHRLDKPFQLSLGDDEGMRGYDYKAFTGNHRMLMNLENRIFTPLENRFLAIGLAQFVDAGYVWSTDYGKSGLSTGAGLRIAFKKYGRTKLIRIDYAYPLINAAGSAGTISISSGHAFNAL